MGKNYTSGILIKSYLNQEQLTYLQNLAQNSTDVLRYCALNQLENLMVPEMMTTIDKFVG